MLQVVTFISKLLFYFWLLFGLALLFLLLAELALRFINRCRKYKSQEFDITKFTLIDKAFDQADSFINCEWYPGYKQEATRIFNNPIWAPYTYWKSKSLRGKYINVEKNFRTTWNYQPFENDQDITRVFCFGGSTMWGWGARDDHTIPSYIAKNCHSNLTTPIMVKNYAQLGYVSTQCLIALITLLQQGKKPDLVIFYDGLNDIFSAYQARVAGIAQNEFNRKFQFESTFIQKLFQQIKNQSQLYCSFKKIITPNHSNSQKGQVRKQVTINPVNLAQSLIDLYLENTKIVSALGQYYGFECLFYWQPVLFTKRNRSDFEHKVYEYHKFWEYFYHCTNEIFNGIKLPRNIFNISNLFSEHQEPLYIDPWHVNETGNRIIADRMFQDISPLFGSAH